MVLTGRETESDIQTLNLLRQSKQEERQNEEKDPDLNSKNRAALLFLKSFPICIHWHSLAEIIYVASK